MSVVTPIPRPTEVARSGSRTTAQGTLSVLRSPEARELLVHPEIVGLEFVRLMQVAAQTVLSYVTRAWESADYSLACAVVPLRGGAAYAPPSPSPSNLNIVTVDDAQSHGWVAKMPGSTQRVILGDTLATGETATSIIETIKDQSGAELKEIIIHGCFAIEGVTRVLERVSELYPDTQVQAIAYEAAFRLPSPGLQATNLAFGHQDFLRGSTWESAEYQWERGLRPGLLLEKCAIYDAGDRIFEERLHRELRERHGDYIAQLDHDELVAECLERSAVVVGLEACEDARDSLLLSLREDE